MEFLELVEVLGFDPDEAIAALKKDDLGARGSEESYSLDRLSAAGTRVFRGRSGGEFSIPLWAAAKVHQTHLSGRNRQHSAAMNKKPEALVEVLENLFD